MGRSLNFDRKQFWVQRWSRTCWIRSHRNQCAKPSQKNRDRTWRIDRWLGHLLGVRGFMERKHRGVGVGDILFSWAQMLILCLGAGCKQKIQVIQCVYIFYVCMNDICIHIIYARPILGSSRTWQGPALIKNMKATLRLFHQKIVVEWVNLNFLFGFIEKQLTWKRQKQRGARWNHQWELRWSWKTHDADPDLHADCELACCVMILMWDDVVLDVLK